MRRSSTWAAAIAAIVALGHGGLTAGSAIAVNPAGPAAQSPLVSAPIHNGGAGLLQLQARSGSAAPAAHGVEALTLRGVGPAVLGSPNGVAPWSRVEGASELVSAWDLEFHGAAPVAALLVPQGTGRPTVIIVSLRHPRLSRANTLTVDATPVTTPGPDWGPLLRRDPRRSSVPVRIGAVSLLLDAAGACTSGLTLEVYNEFAMQAYSPGAGQLSAGTWLEAPRTRTLIYPMDTGIWTACTRTPYTTVSGELTILGSFGGVTTIRFADVPGPHARLSATSIDGNPTPSGQTLPSPHPRFARYLVSLRPGP